MILEKRQVMVEKFFWIADDGTEFETLNACKDYEARQKNGVCFVIVMCHKGSSHTIELSNPTQFRRNKNAVMAVKEVTLTKTRAGQRERGNPMVFMTEKEALDYIEKNAEVKK